MTIPIDLEQEEDGRWLAEIPDLPGVLAYGPTREAATAAARALALRTLADRVEHGESVPEEIAELFAVRTL
jgi:predicted RNase H-like HicB family nuclease